MKNKIGFNLLAWSEKVSDALFPRIERLREIGYDGIEYPMGSPDADQYRRLGATLRELDLEATCVLALGADENPASPDVAVRARGLDRIRWTVDRAADTGAKVICGPFHSAFAYFTRQPPREEELERSAQVLREAGEYARDAGVVLALEALNRFECYLVNTSEQLASLVERTGHPAVRAMFDTHHANIEDRSYADSIRRLAPYLAHVHISENDRGTPGEGHIPWGDVFHTLDEVGYAGWMTIESFNRGDPDFANAINVWRTFSEPWDVAERGYQFVRQGIAGGRVAR